MHDSSAQGALNDSVAGVLREELAHGDAMIATVAPILRHLLGADDNSVFSDEVIARVRAMMAHVSAQMLDAVNAAADRADDRDHDPKAVTALVECLAANGAFLAHVHALAIEWQLTEKLSARLSLDPVLSPLLQALIASQDSSTASAAMSLMAAQARFAQQQRRMQLPLNELPGDLLFYALQVLRAHYGEDAEYQGHAEAADKAIREGYDEGRSRLGQIARLTMGLGGGASAALSVAHAGVGIFLSALALASGQDRDIAVLSTNEGQLARLALALRASGLRPQSIEEQFYSIHPDVSLPTGFEHLCADHAAALLSGSAVSTGG